MKSRIWFMAVALVGLTAAGGARAQTPYAELDNEQGQKVGEATLEETPHGVFS